MDVLDLNWCRPIFTRFFHSSRIFKRLYAQSNQNEWKHSQGFSLAQNLPAPSSRSFPNVRDNIFEIFLFLAQRYWTHLPDPSFQQSLMQSLFPQTNPEGMPNIVSTSMNFQHAIIPVHPHPLQCDKNSSKSNSKETLFKPLKVDFINQPVSFTGPGFLEMLTMTQSNTPKSPSTCKNAIKMKTNLYFSLSKSRCNRRRVFEQAKGN